MTSIFDFTNKKNILAPKSYNKKKKPTIYFVTGYMDNPLSPLKKPKYRQCNYTLAVISFLSTDIFMLSHGFHTFCRHPLCFRYFYAILCFLCFSCFYDSMFLYFFRSAEKIILFCWKAFTFPPVKFSSGGGQGFEFIVVTPVWHFYVIESKIWLKSYVINCWLVLLEKYNSWELSVKQIILNSWIWKPCSLCTFKKICFPSKGKPFVKMFHS